MAVINWAQSRTEKGMRILIFTTYDEFLNNQYGMAGVGESN